MAAAFDQQGFTGTNAAVSTITSSAIIMPGASANGLVVGLIFAGALPTGISVTWNGVGMTAIANASGSETTTVSGILFELVAPATGSGHTLTASWTGATSVVMIVESYTGVDQTGGNTTFPNGNSASNGSSTPATITVTSAVGNMTFAAFGNDGGTAFSGTGSPTPDGTTSPGPNAAWSHLAGSASNTMNANLGAADDWIALGTDIKASATAAQTPYNPWPQLGPILAQKRKSIGWSPLLDHRRRILRPSRNLWIPPRGFLTAPRKLSKAT